ncbi:hypothetical protein F3Y22_tig00111311pilonHSYRG00263 [Hibiscus syriacus]|uniref:RNase H type-1 domain-containing protein n=1 Tax=Hibiscus syriacus TaxID=106335 RepID=A0A6A2YQN3_HIBSY|nr:hypothetical protein F3Y22_tig00111311pilonHSYRG00263 [Hibiscus syriacus]
MAASTWSPPPRGWMCLNTDGAVATLDGRGLIGGVLRNSTGDWITEQSSWSKIVMPLTVIFLYYAITKQRRSGCWITKIQWISRNGNKIADRMAKLASWNHFSLICFDFPPDELVDLLRLEAAVAQQDDATSHA